MNAASVFTTAERLASILLRFDIQMRDVVLRLHFNTRVVAAHTASVARNSVQTFFEKGTDTPSVSHNRFDPTLFFSFLVKLDNGLRPLRRLLPSTLCFAHAIAILSFRRLSILPGLNARSASVLDENSPCANWASHSNPLVVFDC
jgi:hypothetical protein